MQHLDDGTLHALVDGEIPSTELGPIRAHLEACASCRAGLDEARTLAGEALGLVESLDEAARLVGQAGGRPRGRLRDLAWAAGLVLAAGIGYAAGLGRAPEPRQAAADAAAAPVEVAVVEADQIEPAPAPTAREPDDAPATAPEPAAPVPPPPPPAPEATAQAPARAEAPVQEGARRLARDIAAAAPLARPAAELRANADRFQEVSFADAIARLGGVIRLIEGLVPARVLAAGQVVRVLYPAEDGDIALEQVRQADSLAVRLFAPPSVGEDSLARLRARIR